MSKYEKPEMKSEELFEKTVLSCGRYEPIHCWNIGWGSR
jgi:hypothetical protein